MERFSAGTLEEAKVHVQLEYVQEARFDRHTGYEAATRLLRMLPRPTGIFACNNNMMDWEPSRLCAGVDLALYRRHSIVRFDNREFAAFTAQALTSVHQPGCQLGATAARLQLGRIEGSGQSAKAIVLQF